VPDYGHDLEFGTFITPQNQRPQDVVALAQLTERVGLDLATFQDHPYQPAFLDAWTLLTWVAANTTTLRVAPNVLNLPLRQPAVIARAAASLDLLSNGRVELGLGAGAFWDAIKAMGGPRLTPKESVDALSEAIDVIRAIWDVGERGGVRVRGEHYDVRGAKRGPEPAHDIGIWLGAYKPRMLRLTGEKADGWLPSLQYLNEDDIERSNARIDEAALAAGRDPREIRRIINIPPLEVEQLLPYALEHGFSTFILSSDDPRTIQRFGEEIAPALREAVARERAGTTQQPVRGAAKLALRAPGIDYDAVPHNLTAIEPGDKAYKKVRSTYIRTGSPGLVLQPTDANQVVEALTYARQQDVPLSVRSGGHGISGRSTNDGGIVIDVGALNAVEHLGGNRFRIGPGARWGNVAQTLAPHGLGMSSGDYGDVGVGGLATAGGIGFMARKHGLTIDHVTGAEIVLADGRIVRADDELLWAIRGAGGNFGIVTAFELEAYPVGDVVFSSMAFDARATAELLERWGATVEAAPRELTSFLNLAPQRGIAQLYSVYAGDDTQAAIDALTPLLEIGPLLDQQAQLVPYPAIVAPQGGIHRGGSTWDFRSGLLEHITPEAASAIAQLDAPILQIRSVGGAVNDVDPMATAYPHRTQNFALSAVGHNLPWDELVYPHTKGLYLSFDSRHDRLEDAFPGETLERLRRLKALYEPENVFNQNFPITPGALVA
jgi:FAD/FMN-containing dehydrogenase